MFEEFFTQYLGTLLWSETDDNCDPLDNEFGVDDIGNTEELEESARDFFDHAQPLIEQAIDQYTYDYGQAGHDFALTRNGHGAGFWDRGLNEIGSQLTELAKSHGTCNLYVGDDGKVYGS